MSSCVPNSNWFSDYEIQADDYIWAPQIMDGPTPPSAILGFDASGKEVDRSETSCTRKRPRHDSCAASGTKACREKMRRDRLNDRFTELCSILDPGRPPKADKVAILSDATRLLKQLRNEAQKLKESNEALQDTNKNLKVLMNAWKMLTRNKEDKDLKDFDDFEYDFWLRRPKWVEIENQVLDMLAKVQRKQNLDIRTMEKQQAVLEHMSKLN